MKIKLLTIFFCFLLSNLSIAQEEVRITNNNLELQLQQAKQDTGKVRIMTELASHYRLSNPDSSIYYATSALELATKANFRWGRAAAMIELGLVLREQGDFPKALDNLMKGAEIAIDQDFKKLNLLSNLGLGRVYLDLRYSDLGLKHMRERLRLAYELNDFSEKIQGLTSLTYYYVGENHLFPDSAFHYLSKMKSELGQQDDKYLWATFYRTASRYYEALNELDSSMYYSRKSLPIYYQLNDNRNSIAILGSMARIFLKTNQLDSCINYAKRSLDLSQKFKLRLGLISSYKTLTSVYKLKGNYELAFKYQEMSLLNNDNALGAGNMEAIRDMIDERQERIYENERVRKEAQSKIRMNIFLAITITLLIIAFFLFRNSRMKQKAKQRVEAAYDQLKATQSQLIQSEKMASLGELTAGIAHEIQNPLNFVNNFSEVNTELIEEANEELNKGNTSEVKTILNDIKENEQKINHHGKRADAIVKGMLQHSQSSSGKKELTDINALADEYLRLAYHGLRAKDKSFNAIMKTDFDESVGNINIIPQDIGRVVLNLINNAFYAVNEKNKLGLNGYEPTVTVKTKKPRLGGLGVCISVADNGNGIPQKVLDKIFQPFFTTKPTGQGTGLGLSLSYDIVKAHGGELKVETKEARPDDPVGRGEGTMFIILLPTPTNE